MIKPDNNISYTPNVVYGRFFEAATLFLIFVYLSTSPFYVFPSGMPQPADIIMAIACLAPLTFYFISTRIKLNLVTFSFGTFIILAAGINIINFLNIKDLRFIFTVLFYTYNVCVFLSINIMMKKQFDMMLKVILFGVIISVGFETLYVFFTERVGSRASGTFNNPNQLAYFSILSFSILFVIRSHLKRYKLIDYIIFFCCFYTGFMSLSRSFIIIFPIFVLMIIFAKKHHFLLYVGLFTGAIITFATIGVNFQKISFEEIMIIESVERKVNSIGQKNNDSLEARGYGRLIENPVYLILGAGEGGFKRFTKDKIHEIHSGIGTIFFSYGFIGLILFFTGLYGVLRNAPPSYWLLFGCVLTYGIPHQNFRFTLFWVFLAVLYNMKVIVNEKKKIKNKALSESD